MADIAYSNLSRLGNSQGVRIPVDILKTASFPYNLSSIIGGRYPVEIIADSNNEQIIIRKYIPKPAEWTPETQKIGLIQCLDCISKEPLTKNIKILKDLDDNNQKRKFDFEELE